MRAALPLAAAVLALAAAACDQAPAKAETPLPVQTIESEPPRLTMIDPPPKLEERTVPRPATPATPAAPTPSEELGAKTNLPFSPPIAMDPVDGSKVAITPDTPVFSYEDRWYYFASAENKAAFRASPETYVKGSLSKY